MKLALDQPESIEEAAKVVLRLVLEACATHPNFTLRPKEKAALHYLADYAGDEWISPMIAGL